jgi:hypothetical protein
VPPLSRLCHCLSSRYENAWDLHCRPGLDVPLDQPHQLDITRQSRNLYALITDLAHRCSDVFHSAAGAVARTAIFGFNDSFRTKGTSEPVLVRERTVYQVRKVSTGATRGISRLTCLSAGRQLRAIPGNLGPVIGAQVAWYGPFPPCTQVGSAD